MPALGGGAQQYTNKQGAGKGGIKVAENEN
jgi:hypothetical protein